MLLKQKAQVIEDKRAEMKKFIADHKNADGDLDMNVTQIKAFNDRNEELNKLVEEYTNLKRVYDADEQNEKALGDMRQPQEKQVHGEPQAKGEQKSLGALFNESGAGAGKKGQPVHLGGVSLKTLMATTAGFSPEIVRNRPVLASAQRPITLLDVIPMRDVNQPGIKYMEETTFTNNAAETAEGGLYGEAALAFTEKDSPVRKIAVFLPVTDEQLEDVAYMEQYINERLGYMIKARLESQSVSGNGIAPNLRGIMNFVGIQTQAKGVDPVFDAILKAQTKIKTGPFAFPNVNLIHPNDWQEIRLTQSNGRYILGDPDQVGPSALFGVPVVESVVLTEGTGIVQDTNFLELAIYRGIDVQVSNSHADYFVNGKQAIRADIRVLFHSFRPQATCTVTGI